MLLANLLWEMNNPDIALEEYVQYKTEEALTNNQVYIGKLLNMALPPREQRHEWLRFDASGYTKEEQQKYEDQLAKVYYRNIHRVYVLDFARLSEIDKGDAVLDMTERMRMDHMGDDGEVLIMTFIWRDLLGLLLRGQSLEKVTMTDLFFLHSMDEGTVVNVPYFLIHCLFRHAWARKMGAQMSSGHFIAQLESVRVPEGPPRQQGRAACGGAQIDDQEELVISLDVPQDAPVDQEDP
ncbi:hypothetical protein Tco_0353095 [Tanacetum coccineum]